MAGFLRRGEPVLLTGGCPLCRALIDRWSFRHLAVNVFDGTEALQVHFAREADSTATFSRVYGNGLGRGGVQEMSFRDFVAAVEARGGQGRCRHYLAAPLARSMPVPPASELSDELDGDDCDGRDAASKVRFEAYHSHGGGQGTGYRVQRGGLCDELDRIDWEWLAAHIHLIGSAGGKAAGSGGKAAGGGGSRRQRVCVHAYACMHLRALAARWVAKLQPPTAATKARAAGSSTFTHACRHAGMLTRVHACAHTDAHTCLTGDDGWQFDICQLWAGDGCGTTPLHFDAQANFFAQVACMRTYAHAYMQAYVHAHVHTCMHMCMRMCILR